MATKATTPGLEPIDRLEEKIKLLVNTIVRIKGDQNRLAEENGRLKGEIETLRGRVASAENTNGQNFGGGITGRSGAPFVCDAVGGARTWTQVTADLSAYANSTIQLRFRYWTDGAAVGQGFQARDVAAGEQCRPFGGAAIMRVPGRIRISWNDDAALKVEAEAGTQTRSFAFGPVQAGEPSWQGVSAAAWQVAGGAGGRRGGGPPKGGSLRVLFVSPVCTRSIRSAGTTCFPSSFPRFMFRLSQRPRSAMLMKIPPADCMLSSVFSSLLRTILPASAASVSTTYPAAICSFLARAFET